MYAIAGHGITVGFHRYFTHGSFKASRGLQGRARDRRLAGHRGAGHPLGRRPPQAPRLLRPRGRPALAVALRRDGAGAGQGPVVGPRRLALRPSSRPRATSTRPTCMADPDLGGSSRPSRRSSPSRCWLPALIGGLWSMVLAGRADRVLLGLAGPDRPAAPRHLVDQLDLPRHRRAPVPQPRPVRQRLVAGHPVDGRVLAQPAPRRPDLRPARRRPAASSTPAPASSGRSRSSAGRATCAGRVAERSTPGASRRDVAAPPAARRPAGGAEGTAARATGARSAQWHGDRSPGQGRNDHRTVPDDRQAAPRAAHRRRPEAVRRQGFRGRRPSRRSPPRPASPSRSSTSTSAARKASTPSSSTARSRPCSTAITGALSAGAPAARLLERAALALLDYIESSTDGFRILVRDSPGRTGDRVVRQPDQRRREPGRAHPRRRVQARRSSTPRRRRSTPRCSSAWSPSPASGGWTRASSRRPTSPRTWSTSRGTACPAWRPSPPCGPVDA